MLTVSVKYVGYKNYNKHNIRGFKMKISELIKELNKMKDTYGDIKVATYSDECGLDEIKEVKLDEDCGENFITVW